MCTELDAHDLPMIRHVQSVKVCVCYMCLLHDGFGVVTGARHGGLSLNVAECSFHLNSVPWAQRFSASCTWHDTNTLGEKKRLVG